MPWIMLRGKKYEIESNLRPITLVISEYNITIHDTVLGEGASLWSNVNIYGALIGKNVKIPAFVEIRKVTIGDNTKIEPFSFLPEGVKIGKGVFLGPHVCFTNDKYPRACRPDGSQITEYAITPTSIGDYASIGAQCVILCGITIGERAMIGSGSTVVEDVPEDGVVYGPKAALRKTLRCKT